MNYQRDNLTLDDVISTLSALKNKGEAPPPDLDLPRRLVEPMTNFPADNLETEISAEIKLDEDGNASASISFTFRC